MIELLFPWLLFLLPLPLLVMVLLPAYREGQGSIRIPRLSLLSQLAGQQASTGKAVMRRSILPWMLLFLVWVCAVFAVARPQWIGDPLIKTLPSRDLLLALDLSASMSTEDFVDEAGNQVDRLTACQQVLDEFLRKREGDRVGLILFGSAAFVQVPFTEDLNLCRTLLNEARVGMAGPKTVVGDAVGLAMSTFERSEQQEKTLIILTDGNDTGSKVSPIEAARIGADQGVTIHTIAVGDPEAVGEEKIDEESLEEMARITGGGFFRADDRAQLASIYEQLDQLETNELQTESYRPKSELFFWPLGAFLVIGLAFHGVAAIRTRAFLLTGNSRRPLAGAAGLLLMLLATGAGFPAMAEQFHFLRPWWLLLILPAAGLIYLNMKQSGLNRIAMAGSFDRHLLESLFIKPEQTTWFRPVMLLGVVWALAILGLAGPTWERETSPFANDQAAIVFVMEATPTMLAEDVQPTRMERSAHKVRDLLALRKGADAALVTYAGSAHLVMPITNDARIIESFADELGPQIMPLEGDVAAAAVALANQVLKDANRPGSIVLITDGVEASQNQLLGSVTGNSLHILAVATDLSRPLPLDSPQAPPIDLPALQETAKAAHASLTLVTADQTDVESISARITSSFVPATNEEDQQQWKDMGYWLTPWVVLLSLIWFRQGWMIRWNL